jgi:hypothetical protein
MFRLLRGHHQVKILATKHKSDTYFFIRTQFCEKAILYPWPFHCSVSTYISKKVFELQFCSSTSLILFTINSRPLTFFPLQIEPNVKVNFKLFVIILVKLPRNHVQNMKLCQILWKAALRNTGRRST